MPSIFEAATLIVYRVPGEHPAPKVQFIIDELVKEDPVIRQDFHVKDGVRPMTVRISLPLIVHETDHDAWKHVDYLNTQLCEKKKLDCHWAWTGWEHKDRSTRITYTIKPITSVGAPPSIQWAGYGDPNLQDYAFRLQAINAALAIRKILPREYEVYNESASSVHTATGYFYLDSPIEVTPLVSAGEVGPIPIKYSKYTVEFGYPRGLVPPTSCTTIGLVVRGDGRDESTHLKELREHVAKYCLATGRHVSISNVRMSKENHGYILCDPGDIITAQGLCESPMPNKRYFRQTFFTNADAANYTKTYEMKYDRQQALVVQNARDLDDEAGHTVRTLILEALVLEFERGHYEDPKPPTQLDVERQRRSLKVDDWIKDRGQEKGMSPHRKMGTIHASNFTIAQQTEYGSEHLDGAQGRYQEDYNALQIQISIHKEVMVLDRDYDWALERLEVVSRVLERLKMKDKLEVAKNRMLNGRFVHVSPVRKSTVPGETGRTLSRKEILAEHVRLSAESKIQAAIEYQQLIVELSLLIANDPHYQPPPSTFSTSPTPSSPEPMTPPNTYQVLEPSTPTRLPGSIDEIEKKPGISQPPPPPIAQKRKHDEIEILTAPQLHFNPQAVAEIRKRQTVIDAKRRGLRTSFGSIPAEMDCGPRDKIQREIDGLQRDLERFKAEHGTSHPPRQFPTGQQQVKTEHNPFCGYGARR